MTPIHKPKKKPKKKYTVAKADELVSIVVRSRGVCQAHGLDSHQCGGRLQCAHIITRGCFRLRFDFQHNCLCLCAGHHNWYTNHPDQWILDFIPGNFPDQYEYVMAHRHEFAGDTNYKILITALEQYIAINKITKPGAK